MVSASRSELTDIDLIIAWRYARAVYEEATDALRTVGDNRVASQECLNTAMDAVTEMLGLGKEAASRGLLLPTQLGT